jgi:hypothetical protein
MQLSVEMLDNKTKSAVINVGKNSGYVEAFVDAGNLVLNVFDKQGQVLMERFISIQDLKASPSRQIG